MRNAAYIHTYIHTCRDVAVNFRVVNDTTISLGAEGHVCEMQLILKSFAELRVCMYVFVCVCVCACRLLM